VVSRSIATVSRAISAVAPESFFTICYLISRIFTLGKLSLRAYRVNFDVEIWLVENPCHAIAGNLAIVRTGRMLFMISKPKLEIIQLLRALAVMCVVVTHIAHELAGMLQDQVVGFNEKRFPGDFGVDLFFVISGFIMVYTCWGVFGRPGASLDFIRRRIIRIVPLYWLATTLMILVVILIPQNVNTATADWRQWLSSYLFFPYARESDGLIRPVLGLGWSLQYEMYFYMLFAFGLLIQRKAAVIFVLLAMFVVFLVANLLMPDSASNGILDTILRFLSHTITLEFGGGVFLGYAYMSGARLEPRLGIAFAAFGLFLLIIAPGFNDNIDRLRLLHYGIPAMLMLAGAVCTVGMDDVAIARPLLGVGEASYSIYLVHPFVIGGVSVAFKMLLARIPMDVLYLISTFSIVVLLVSLVAGTLVHKWVDTPLTGWLKSAWPGKSRLTPGRS
jgi:peptidoglycan/LPS O-acetylase OafA/YrhL